MACFVRGLHHPYYLTTLLAYWLTYLLTHLLTAQVRQLHYCLWRYFRPPADGGQPLSFLLPLQPLQPLADRSAAKDPLRPARPLVALCARFGAAECTALRALPSVQDYLQRP